MGGILLLLGTNLGDRVVNLSCALRNLESEGCSVVSTSSVYETEPWGVLDQPWFLNIVVEISTNRDPYDLLDICQKIERKMGRIRHGHQWGERLIDIDILYHHDVVINEDKLIVPHKEIPNRRFTLLPLAEKWSHFIHPSLRKSNGDLLNETPDTSACNRTDILIR